jgi:hypothetical protein
MQRFKKGMSSWAHKMIFLKSVIKRHSALRLYRHKLFKVNISTFKVLSVF